MAQPKQPRTRRPGWLAVGLLLLAGCQQEMANQPYYRPLEPSAFFPDGRAARPIPDGAVPRGGLQLGPFYTGRDPAEVPAPVLGAAAAVGNVNPAVPMPITPPVIGAVKSPQNGAPYLKEFPFPAEQLGAMMRRGRERYDIYCAPCHDKVGTGRGMIVQRGFTAPPSLHTDLARGYLLRGEKLELRKAPVGYYFDVITNGFGAMPDYRSQIPPGDRWAIVAYIRALQLSQGVPLDDVPDVQARQKLLATRGEQ